MPYVNYYKSPLGDILLTADDEGLTGLYFAEQENGIRQDGAIREDARRDGAVRDSARRDGVTQSFNEQCSETFKEKNLPVFDRTKQWLDQYFAGEKPHFTPTLHLIGTDFRINIWKLLQQIPYGTTKTYGEIAHRIAQQQRVARMSAQAVGGAVGHNNISIIIPCHRVIGTNGNLTGYASGIDKKISLLKLEGVNTNNLYIPARSSRTMHDESN